MTPPSTLVSLPDEILTLIFQYLDVSTVVALNITARRFVDLSNEPLLWREFCRSGFRYWDDRKKFRALLLDSQYDQWKSLYTSRHANSAFAATTIRDIINDPVGRSDKIQAIVDHGYQGKDSLMKLFYESPTSPDHLAQKYWCHIAIGCLNRTAALEQWWMIKHRPDLENATERGLAAFDMFILDEQREGDIDDVFDRLDSYVEAVRKVHPDILEQTPRQRASTIAECLLEEGWLAIHADREYHSLDNAFLGHSLHSRLRDSLPLISAVIYCYVCRQLNLRAQPCNFPNHVHAIVQSPIGIDLDGQPVPDEAVDAATTEPASQNTTAPTPLRDLNDALTSNTTLYMDPFHSNRPVPVSALQEKIRFLGLPSTPGHMRSYLSVANHRNLIFRSANNIATAVNQNMSFRNHSISPTDALYAVSFAFVLFPTDPANHRTNVSELTRHWRHYFEHDIHIYRTHVLPLTSSLPDALAYRRLALQVQEDELDRPKPKFRPNSSTVRYRVGQVFRHRAQGYIACIYGWDATCQMPHQWISMNQVDRLPKGRNQPFYNVLVADDGTTRYVAEENVILLGSKQENTHESSEDQRNRNVEQVTREQIEMFGVEVGKHFKRFDWDQGKFVSNVRHQYPED